MKRYLLLLWFIGRNYYGSQQNEPHPSIEGELIKTLIKTEYISDFRSSNLYSASRTDRGVNAREWAVCFSTEKELVARHIDNFLPKDIGITAWAEVDLDFNPRYAPKTKSYRYYIPKSIIPTHILKDPKTFERLQQALSIMVGTHDFTLFYHFDRNKPDKNTTIELKRLTYYNINDALIFVFTAKFFLWEQIRRLTRILFKLILGNVTIQDLKNKFDPEYIKAHPDDKQQAFNAEGLILWSVDYGDIEFHPLDYSKTTTRRQRMLNDNKIDLAIRSAVHNALHSDITGKKEAKKD